MKAVKLFRKSISIIMIIMLLTTEFVVIGQNIVNAMTETNTNTKNINSANTNITDTHTTNTTNMTNDTATDKSNEIAEENKKKSEAKLEISNTNLSTLQNNENILFLITLVSNSEQYDLYKNPEIYITTPKEINITVKTMRQLNLQDELTIDNTGIQTLESGEKIIKIALKGEQKEYVNKIDNGLQIAFMADISTENTVPTQETKISMKWTNENREGESFETEQNIKLTSKYGMLTVNKVTDFNDNGDEINYITNSVETAKLDEQAKSRNVKKTINLINNYGKDVENVSYIGQIAGIDTISNFEMSLVNDVKISKENAKIYYSEDANAGKDSETWKENIEDVSKVKTFKIELDNMAPEEKVDIEYELNIPANLDKNERTYLKSIINYDYEEKTNSEVSAVVFETEQTETEVVEDKASEESSEEAGVEDIKLNVEKKEDIGVNVKAISGGKEIKEGDSVVEGQGITYQLTIKNNTDTPLNNIKVVATNENAIYYDKIVKKENVNGEMMDMYHIEENEKLTSKDFTIETLAPGETKSLGYQISVKEVDGDDQKLTGKITILADGLEQKEYNNITNNIEQGQIKITMRNQYSEEIEAYTGNLMQYTINVKNITDKTLKDIVVEVQVSDLVSFDPQYANAEENSNYEYVSYENNVVKFKVKTLKQEENCPIYLALTANKFDINEKEKYLTAYTTATVDNKQFISNDIRKTIYQNDTKIEAEQISNVEGTMVSNGDNIQFIFNITNKGNIERTVEFTDNIQPGLNINEMYVLQNGQKINLQSYSGMIMQDITLKEGEKVQVIIDTTLNVDLLEKDITAVSNEATIKGENVDVTTNKLEYKIKEKQNSTTPVTPDEPSTPSNPTSPNTPNIEDNAKYSISGQAWLDSNANGQKDTIDYGIEGIDVNIIDAKTGNIVSEQRTTNDGKYEFKDLDKGNYIIIFKYDTGKYSITEYKKDGVKEEENSDIISKTINLNNEEIIVGATETLNLDSNLKNIDAGFKENKIFDLKVDKYVSKVEVKNHKGVQNFSYDKEKLAKIEIAGKQLDNSTITVEYKIEITNEGEAPGYANEITDKIPSELKFNKELNKEWSQNNDGTVTNTGLKNKLINAGETKTLTLTLTKDMTRNTTGTIINLAEIKKSSNDYAISDNNQGNNSSSAQLIISVKTGRIVYIGLIITFIATLGIGLYFIKEKVLKK